MPALEIGVAGPVTMRIGEQPIDDPAISRLVSRRVLAALSLEARPISRSEIGDIVWDGRPPASWDVAIRGAVSQIRRAVEEAGGADPIRTGLGGYALDPTVSVDVITAERQLREAEVALRNDQIDAAASLSEAASEILSRPLLQGDGGAWFDEQRRGLAQLAVRALLVQSASATSVGDHGRAVEAARRAVATDQFLESAYQRLMSAQAAAGNRADALTTYRRCRELLAEELGISPSPTTEAVYLELLGSEEVNPGPVRPLGFPASLERGASFVGRSPELDQLEAAIEQCRSGASVGIVIAGSAGIGKSCLAAEFAARASERGATVLHGRFDPGNISGLDAFAEVLGQVGVAWPSPLLPTGSDPSSHRKLHATAAAPLRRCSTDAPVVMILDDLHWANRTAAGLLAHLLEPGVVPSLMIIATCRTDVTDSATSELLRRSDRLAWHEIRLDALDGSALSELASRSIGAPPEPQLVEWMLARSGGSPLFATMLLNDIAQGCDRDDASRSIEAHVRDALARLPPAGRRMLALAAVIGPEMQIRRLAAAAGIPAAAVGDAVSEAVEARLIGYDLTDAARLRFVHALIHDAVLDEIDSALRAELHRAVAAGLLCEVDPDPLELARHLSATGDVGDAVSAAGYVAVAARQLADEGLPDEAVEVAELALAELAPLVESIGPFIEHAELLVAAALAEMSRNGVEAGRRHLRQAAQVAIDVGDPSPLRHLIGGMRAPEQSQLDEDMDQLIVALLDLSAHDPRVRAVLLCWRSYEQARSDPERSTEIAAEAIAVARRRVDPELLRSCLHAWHFNGIATTHPGDRRDAMNEALRLDHRLSARHQLSVSLVYLATDLLELADVTGATQATATARSIIEQGAPVLVQWLVARTEAMIAIATGDWVNGDRALLAAGDAAARSGSPEALLQTFAQQCAPAFHHGTLGELLPTVATMAAAPDAPPIITSSHALFAAECGDTSAYSATTTAIRRVLAMPPTLNYWPSLAFAAEAAARTHHAGAAALAERIRPRSGAHLAVFALTYLGSADRLLGNLAGAQGQLDAADTLLSKALEEHRASNVLPFVARNAAELVLVLRRRGTRSDRHRADDLAAEADDVATRLDLTPVKTLLSDGTDGVPRRGGENGPASRTR